MTRGTEVRPGCSSVWGLPLQFYFVGFWLGVHRVRDPAVCSAQGSVGGSTKAQLGPVPSLSWLLACRKNSWQWASLPAHAHPERQADKGVEEQTGCLWPARAPHPGKAEASAVAGHIWERWGLPSLHHLPTALQIPAIPTVTPSGPFWTTVKQFLAHWPPPIN